MWLSTFDTWKRLGEFLVVKYNDGVVKRMKNGQFERNSIGQPAGVIRPGYPKEFLARRARFYSSILDTHFLQPGKLYEELPDTYVIFITENDVLHDNLPLYNIRRRIDENAKCFEDGSHIIYVNSQRRDNTALGKLMQDLYCTEPKNLHYHEFAERMEFLKYSIRIGSVGRIRQPEILPDHDTMTVQGWFFKIQIIKL